MRYKSMNNMLQGFCNKQHNKMRGLYIDGLMDYQWDTKLVIIRVDHSWVLKFMARATILALVIVSLPWINTVMGYLSSRYESNYAYKVDHEMANKPTNLESLPAMLQDLVNEGLLRTGDRSLLVSNCNEKEIDNSQVVKDYNPDLISFSDSTKQNLVPSETFDLVFAYDYPQSSNFIERALKVGGILVVPLSDIPLVDEFPHPSNYKIVYVRKFDSTIVAMKKLKNASLNSSMRRRLNALATNAENASGSSSRNRKLFDKEHLTSLSQSAQHDSKLVRLVDSEYRKFTNAKEAALKKLEDVLLEPPRAASGKSSRYLKKTHFLPDLMGVSLESYARRVFIDVSLQEKNQKSSDNSHSTWFSKHYPTKNTKFEILKIETVTEKSSGKEVPLTINNMSDWLSKNVKENEYVVMKAEADVIEKMMNTKSIRLIDELFLECKHQGIKKSGKKHRRPYWECLSLYGLLRDEGIAVHQWWG
ncbi:putative ATPase family AAA domain-containing protein-like [Capsicum annuum]|nr:putative ATPase family AAA domain-containing protein-like [Capsicum annuum]